MTQPGTTPAPHGTPAAAAPGTLATATAPVPLAAGGATSTTTVEASITLTIAGQPYTLTGTVGNDLIVEYHADFDKAISLGTIGDIAPSIASTLNFPDLATEITNAQNEAKSLPVLGSIASLLFSATARITDLEINTQTKTYGVGLALDFTQLPAGTPTPTVFNITLLSFGFKVTRTNTAAPPA